MRMSRAALTAVVTQTLCGLTLPLQSSSLAASSGSSVGFAFSRLIQFRRQNVDGSTSNAVCGHRQVAWGRFSRKQNMHSSSLVMMAKGGVKERKQAAPFIDIEHETEGWKLAPAIEILREGGVGIVPTDTCYMFVTDVLSRKGVERLYDLKQSPTATTTKKPLSLLCSSLSQMSKYTTASNQKNIFKMLKTLLPGPYTFIFVATNELPRMIVEHKHHVKMWKRKEIGVRIPDDPVLLELLEGLDSPLLCAGVPREESSRSPISAASDAAVAQEKFGTMVDFVVGNGLRPEKYSTVVDMTQDPPELLREGEGSWEEVQEFLQT